MSVARAKAVAFGSQETARPLRGKIVSRLKVLLTVLALFAAAAIYDVAIARPGSISAEKQITALIEERTRISAQDGGSIMAEEVHQAIGRQPTWIERHPGDGYVVDYFCWWGYVPLISLRRHYLVIVYAGEGSQLVFSSHHLNQRPPRRALPMPFVEKRPQAIVRAGSETLPQKERRLLRRPIAAAWLEPKRLLSVANERSGSVSIVDFSKRKVVDEFVIGRRLADFVAHPLGGYFFAVDPEGNELIVLRRIAESLTVAERQTVGTYPVSVAVSPNGQFVSVASQWSRKLSIFQFSQDDSSCVITNLSDISLPFNPREHQFSTDISIIVNDAFAERSCEVNIETRIAMIRDKKSVPNRDPASRLMGGIEARSEIHGGTERIVGTDFTITLGPVSKLTPEDRGEELFYSRTLSPAGQSCHDCHPFGHTTFDLADTLADGSTGTPKRILTLLGTSQTYPWAWNGSINELDEQVRKSLETTLHVQNVKPQQVIDINSFLHTLSAPPPVEPATDAPDDHAQLVRGQMSFQELGCLRCHVPTFSYTSGEVFDVGISDEHGQIKFNPPSLLGVGQGYSFFHDGRAKTLAEVFTVHGHQLSRELSAIELSDLLRFLRSL